MSGQFSRYLVIVKIIKIGHSKCYISQKNYGAKLQNWTLYLYQILISLLGHLHFFFAFMRNLFRKHPIFQDLVCLVYFLSPHCVWSNGWWVSCGGCNVCMQKYNCRCYFLKIPNTIEEGQPLWVFWFWRNFSFPGRPPNNLYYIERYLRYFAFVL